MSDVTLMILGMAPGGGQSSPGDFMTSMLPLIAVFAIIYILMIRPEQKRRAEHKKFLDTLDRGTEVVTTGGIFGKVVALTDTVVTLEIAPKVTIRVQRAQVSGAAAPATAEKVKDKEKADNPTADSESSKKKK